MRILFICDSLEEVGGVANYTRPLFNGMREEGVDVTALYTGTNSKDYSFFRPAGVIRKAEGIYEFFNCPITATNFGHPGSDLRNRRMEKSISRFLDRNHFDIAHIHSMVGMPVSLYRLLQSKGIKIVTTVHEYWWLCPYRVMVDFNNRICDGPENIDRCAYCVQLRGKTKTDFHKVTVAKLEKTFPKFHRWLFSIYRKLHPLKDNGNLQMEFKSIELPKDFHSEKAPVLAERLRRCIEALNMCEVVVAVSKDVKRILAKYGVEENRILVQHIGSLIADKRIEHTKKVECDDFKFGFIGGVSFYKGVHQMVQAYLMLPLEMRRRSSVEIYGNYHQNYKESMEKGILLPEDRERIHFHGRFLPKDLPEITNKIDISILPSLCADTAPQTIFESFNAGLPIIAPKVGGFPDFVIDGKTGFLYEAADFESLSKCMKKVLESPSVVDSLRGNLPKTKSIPENIKELTRLYSSLLSADRW